MKKLKLWKCVNKGMKWKMNDNINTTFKGNERKCAIFFRHFSDYWNFGGLFGFTGNRQNELSKIEGSHNRLYVVDYGQNLMSMVQMMDQRICKFTSILGENLQTYWIYLAVKWSKGFSSVKMLFLFLFWGTLKRLNGGRRGGMKGWIVVILTTTRFERGKFLRSFEKIDQKR